ncbi:DUF3152 domain-containing protein [Streptomyces fructofermentans]|uniref:DUF3152 domain-containing protein n=1 Tax=Streptomyces fructofermentans TaxID=152141 RepID=UPI0033D55DD6
MQSARQQEHTSTARSAVAPRHGVRRRSSHRRGRPRSRGRRYLVGALAVAALLGSAAFFLDDERSGTPSAAPHRRGTATATPTPPSTPTPTPKSTPTPTSTEIDVPLKGSGTFVTARSGGAKVGRGPRPLRYVVKVESGLDIPPARAADEIADILAAPRGWTENPAHSFQLVGAGEPHDLTVTIATPGTADALCWEGIQQDTQGVYNCEVPGGVVVNLKRWVSGSPTFDGPIHDYRALIINHEMGHFLGHTHRTCAGPGQLAPVMMQQIKGLHGCVANAWPYDKDGRLVTGPRVQ